MTSDESEQKVYWWELAAAAVIGFLAGYGAVALASRFVSHNSVATGTLPSRPCSLAFPPQSRPPVTAAGYEAAQQMQHGADVYRLSRKGALMPRRNTKDTRSHSECMTSSSYLVSFTLMLVMRVRAGGTLSQPGALCSGATAVSMLRHLADQMCRCASCAPSAYLADSAGACCADPGVVQLTLLRWRARQLGPTSWQVLPADSQPVASASGPPPAPPAGAAAGAHCSSASAST